MFSRCKIPPAILMFALAAGALPVWGGPWVAQVRQAPDGSGPRTVAANVSLPASSDVTARAQAALATLAPVLDLNLESAALVVRSVQHSPIGDHVRYNQTYRGLPVLTGEVAVHFHSDGRTVLVRNDTQRVADLVTTPALSHAQALALCRTALERQVGRTCIWGRVNVERLAIAVREGRAQLVYEFLLDSVNPSYGWYALVDAQTGVLVGSAPSRFSATGTAQVFLPSPMVALQDPTLQDNNNADSPAFAGAYTPVVLQGLDGSGYLRGDYCKAFCNESTAAFRPALDFVFPRNQDGFEQAMVYYYIDAVQRQLQAWGYTDINNRQILAEVNYARFNNNCVPLEDDNAYYHPDGFGTGYLLFGTGGVDDAEDGEVILHELWHAIQDNMIVNFAGNVIPDSIPGRSIAEGMADAWATSYAMTLSNGYGDGCYAEWDASGRGQSCTRVANSNNVYPNNYVSHWASVHTNGTILSGALFRIRRQIGLEAFSHHMLGANYFLPRVPPDYRDAAQAFVDAGVWRYGFRFDHLVRIALENRGLLAPLEPSAGLDHLDVLETPLVIAANDADGATRTITIGDRYPLRSARLYARIARAGAELDQLRVTLISPAGTHVPVFDVSQASGPLDALAGETVEGNWQLHVYDSAAGGGGGYATTLYWWGLSFEVAPAGVPHAVRLYR